MYSLTAGAVGAVISVMVRVSHGDHVEVDVDQGRRITWCVGAFRPVIGAIFGVVIFVFIHAGLIPFEPADGKDVSLFFCGISFLAGFSERCAQDTILHTAQTIKSATEDPNVDLQKGKL